MINENIGKLIINEKNYKLLLDFYNNNFPYEIKYEEERKHYFIMKMKLDTFKQENKL